MASIVSTIEISRSPGDVFDYVTDPARFAEWQEGLVSASVVGDAPRRVGSRATMTRRVGRGVRTVTTELTEFDPPRSFAFRGIDGPIRPVGKGTIEPIGDGSHSRLRFELDFAGRGFGKLLVPLVRSQARKDVPQSHANLKKRLESGA